MEEEEEKDGIPQHCVGGCWVVKVEIGSNGTDWAVEEMKEESVWDGV